jgi:hypothetical protein
VVAVVEAQQLPKNAFRTEKKVLLCRKRFVYKGKADSLESKPRLDTEETKHTLLR